MGVDVGIERFAQIRADMDGGVARDLALARAGVSADEWSAAQRRWLEGMGAEIARGRFELTNQYTAAFLAHQRASTPVRPVAKPASPPEPGREAPRGEGPETVATPATPATPDAKPSYLAAAAHVAVSPAITISAAPDLPRVVRNQALASTGTVDVSALRSAMLPFAARPAGASAPTAEPSGVIKAPVLEQAPKITPLGPAHDAAKKHFASTMAVDVSAFGSALPFPAQGASAPAGSAHATPPAAPSIPVHRPPAALAGTSLTLDIPKGPVVPFAAAASGERASPAPGATAPVATAPIVSAPSASAPTAPLPATGSGSSVFAPPRESREPREALTVEQYASLCVEMGLEGASARELVARYGLTMETAAAVDAEWKARMAAQPAVRESFDRAYAAYRAWLLSKRAAAPKP